MKLLQKDYVLKDSGCHTSYTETAQIAINLYNIIAKGCKSAIYKVQLLLGLSLWSHDL
jgi:hypothetical protein